MRWKPSRTGRSSASWRSAGTTTWGPGPGRSTCTQTTCRNWWRRLSRRSFLATEAERALDELGEGGTVGEGEPVSEGAYVRVGVQRQLGRLDRRDDRQILLVDAPLVVDRLLEGCIVKALCQPSLDPVVRRLGGADRAGGVQQAAFTRLGEHLERDEVWGDHVVAGLAHRAPELGGFVTELHLAPQRHLDPVSLDIQRLDHLRQWPEGGLVDEGEMGNIAEVLDHHAKSDWQLVRGAVAPGPGVGVEPRQVGWLAQGLLQDRPD